MTATLILYGCFASHGREYDFDVLAPGDKALGRKIRSARLTAPCWFAGRFENRVFFGTRDLVANFLGSEHPIARDRARNLEFILAYVEKGTAALPAWSEIASLEARVRGDLRSAAELAMTSSRSVSREVIAQPLRFAGPRVRGDAPGWDGLIAQLSPGEAGIVISGRRGGVLCVPWESEASDGPRREAGSDRYDDDRPRRRGCALRGAGAGILIAMLGAAAALGISSTSPGDAAAPGDHRQ